MKDTLTVYIGRFSPFHAGHASVLRRALQTSDKVLVLIGSSGGPRTIKNPWTYEERAVIIRNWAYSEESGLSPAEQDRLHFAHLHDTIHDDAAWAQRVKAAVAEVMPHTETQIRLTGSAKDSSAYYLKMFPEWGLDLVEPEVEHNGQPYHSTRVRGEFFCVAPPRGEGSTGVYYGSGLASTEEFLRQFRRERSAEYARLKREYSAITNYKEAWVEAPYPPIFSTVDAVVIHNSKVLMVRRKSAPGEGLLALPGGFVNQDETLFDAAIRELREETNLDVSEEILRWAYEKREIFDTPGRSLRGRTITTAHLFDLYVWAEKTPEVKGGDDAASAEWISLEDLPGLRDQIYEDHLDIIFALTYR